MASSGSSRKRPDLINRFEDVANEVKELRRVLGNQERLFNEILTLVQKQQRELNREAAFDLVVIELNKVLDEMWKERRINRDNSIELHNRMIKRTEGRDYRLHAQ